MKPYTLPTILVTLACLPGCASIKPHIACMVATGKAEVQQGIAGLNTSQDLSDADPLCGGMIGTQVLKAGATTGAVK